MAVAAPGRDRHRRRRQRSTTSTVSKRGERSCGGCTGWDATSSVTSTSAAGRATGRTPRVSRSVIGRRYEGFPDERWLDIRRFQLFAGGARGSASRSARARGSTRSSPTTSPAGKTRPASRSSAAAQLRFNRWVAAPGARPRHGGRAEERRWPGRQLLGAFDFAIVEQCFQYDECGCTSLRRARQGGLRGRVRTRAVRVLRRGERQSASAPWASPTTSSPLPGAPVSSSAVCRAGATGWR